MVTIVPQSLIRRSGRAAPRDMSMRGVVPALRLRINLVFACARLRSLAQSLVVPQSVACQEGVPIDLV